MKILSLAGQWQFRQAGTEEWLPAQVPGCVHTDLMANGRIPDPFVADNEKRVQWVAESDWEYERVIPVDAELLAEERLMLVCDGLDTLAEVRLNGQIVGKAENMFRRYSWDVKSLLHEGDNLLSIAFSSPVEFARARQAENPLRGVSQAIEGGPHLRKAPCQFGWDWGPQLPPTGIWKDIRLEGHSTGRITDVHIRQRHDGGHVTLSAQVSVERWAGGPSAAPGMEVVCQVTQPDGTVVEETAALPVMPGDTAAGTTTITVETIIDRPELWWPNGYGSQKLYQVDIALARTSPGLLGRAHRIRSAVGVILGSQESTLCIKEGTTPPDVRLDSCHYQVGLRTIELRQQPDEWGKSFQFVVNGVPIFAKGSDWIPADSFPTRISDAHLEHLIRSAAETHQNMLRVWGGGFYEEERFYDLCDRYGILVWQDFIFSCSMYPMDDLAFLDNVRAEVADNVRRLRHRASLALWCGNNEMEWGWCSWGWDKPEYQAVKAAYDRFFHHTLPEWCAADDPDTAYWPSSPSSGVPFEDPNGQVQGDAHYWEVWHGRKPFTAYRDQYPRFMSEFGFQSLPPLETVRTYAEETDWNMTSYIMEHHQRNASGNGLIIGQMTDSFRLPKDFPSLVYLSMVLQAEGIRYGVEHWRRHMDRVAGTLYWQLNDTWPVASWASLDYFGRWKALHYAARRFYAPVLLSLEEVGTSVGIHVTSDLQTPWQGTVRWSLQTLGGATITSGERAVLATPLSSLHVDTVDLKDRISDENVRLVVFICELYKVDALLARQLVTFAPNKHLSLADPQITTDLRGDAGRLAVDVTAASLARFVELRLDGADALFSDNYFDVPAGGTVHVTAELPPHWSADQARAALKVRSLYHSFA